MKIFAPNVSITLFALSPLCVYSSRKRSKTIHFLSKSFTVRNRVIVNINACILQSYKKGYFHITRHEF